ncbi:hypothetical protein DB30_02698 [Enhygromyxa salina]|uniref:Uncharacterized protein n=1 Tax=Enhygromyxa salina TaxID=215803 RepID=A0A0C2DIC5_9BACT|nr:hypothetical protein DB30_02698 [Enhygromyxa salina]
MDHRARMRTLAASWRHAWVIVTTPTRSSIAWFIVLERR